MCFICHASLNHCKTSYLKRHYEAKHESFAINYPRNLDLRRNKLRNWLQDLMFLADIINIFFIYLYFYPPDSQESDGGANTQGTQLPRPASGGTKILLSA